MLVEHVIRLCGLAIILELPLPATSYVGPPRECSLMPRSGNRHFDLAIRIGPEAHASRTPNGQDSEVLSQSSCKPCRLCSTMLFKKKTKYV